MRQRYLRFTIALLLSSGCASSEVANGAQQPDSDLDVSEMSDQVDAQTHDVTDLSDTPRDPAPDTVDVETPDVPETLDAPDTPHAPDTIDATDGETLDSVADPDVTTDADDVTVTEPSHRVLLIGIDGVRPDALWVAETPNLDGLIAAGAFSGRSFAGDITYSGPGWATILTGVWRDKHGIDDNTFAGRRVDLYPDFFTLHKRTDSDAVAVSIEDWQPINDEIVTGADVEQSLDTDAQVVSASVAVLGSQSVDPDALFVYLAAVDDVGHASGFDPMVPEYVAAIEVADTQVGTILDALESRATFEDEDWLVLVVTDHGGTSDGSHGDNIPEHRTTFFLAAGPSVVPGPLYPPPGQVDVVPTALAHLGVPLDPAWGLDGRPVALSPTSTPVASLGENLIFNGDAEYDRGFDDATPDGYASAWHDPGAMTIVRYGSDGYPALVDPGPTARGDNLFVGGVAAASTLDQVIDVSSLSSTIDTGTVDYTLSGWLGGYLDQEDAGTLTATFFPAGADAVGSQSSFLFRGAEVADYDVEVDVTRAGSPTPIDASQWPGMWADGPDAAINWGDGKAYFFRSGEFLEIDIATRTISRGPSAITSESWPGMWADGPDAAINWGDGKAYFFRGGDYIRFDIELHTTDADYPRAISASTWPGLEVFDAIDAVLEWPNGKAFFFRGSQYIRYDIANDSADSGYPRDIEVATWPGLWTDRVDAALLWDIPDSLALGSTTIGPVTATDRGSSTRLLFRNATGDVPAGTRAVRVRLSATRAAGTVADAFADNLSLVFE